MSINEKYLMAGMMAAALVVPMAGNISSYADDTRVVTEEVNFRTGPSTNYGVICKISEGATVTYLGTDGKWVKVSYNSKTGYIYGDYVSTQYTSKTRYVNSNAGLNVRKGPSTSYQVVKKLDNGAEVTVLSSENGWSKIDSESTTGYVSSSYLSASKVNEDNSSSTATTKYVNSSVGLNVRKGPSTSYQVVTRLDNGTKVTVLSSENGWSKITSGNITGYVTSSYLSSNKIDEDNSSSITTTKYVNSSVGLNVRKGPSTSYQVVTRLDNGTKVTVLSSENGWSKITSGNITGYVTSSYLSSKAQESSEVLASRVVNYAKQFLGKPYVWGAQGPNGFDCSGFTYYVYKNSVGITLPRTSYLQSSFGTYVSKSNLKAGDLLFFDTVGANNGGITHCGIYIGDGQFIHAASGQGKVVINNLYSSYYVNAYVNARRVL